MDLAQRKVPIAAPQLLGAREMRIGERSSQLEVSFAAEVGLDDVVQRARRWIAPVQRRCGGANTNAIELRRHIEARSTDAGACIPIRCRLFDSFRSGGGVEERLERQDLEENRAEREDVGTLVEPAGS